MPLPVGHTELAPAVENNQPASLHEKLLDSLFDGVYFVDLNRTITYWNQGAQDLTGYTPAEAVGRHCFDNFLAHVDESGRALCIGYCPLAQTIADGERRSSHIYLQHKLGHRVPVSVRVAPLLDDAGNIIGAVEVFSDNSALKHMERRAGELERLAYHDPLTGVANRRYVEFKINQALEEMEQLGRAYGLLMLDLDCFKAVNDTYGHAAGDSALATVCRTVTHNLRPSDTIGRWGGDEFIIIAADVNAKSLQAFAERCRTLIAESTVRTDKDTFPVTVSIGATLLQPGDSAESAVSRADRAMYERKAAT